MSFRERYPTTPRVNRNSGMTGPRRRPADHGTWFDGCAAGEVLVRASVASSTALPDAGAELPQAHRRTACRLEWKDTNMRNVWKGLVIGAVTGAGIGLVMDIAAFLGRRFGAASEQTRESIRDRAPDLAASVAATANDMAQRLDQADIPGRASDLAHRVADSSAGQAVAGAAQSVGEAIGQAATRATKAVGDTIPGNDRAHA